MMTRSKLASAIPVPPITTHGSALTSLVAPTPMAPVSMIDKAP